MVHDQIEKKDEDIFLEKRFKLQVYIWSRNILKLQSKVCVRATFPIKMLPIMDRACKTETDVDENS